MCHNQNFADISVSDQYIIDITDFFFSIFPSNDYRLLISYRALPISDISDILILGYSTLVENQLNTKIKSLLTDRGREYLSDLFKAYCDEKGYS